MRITLRINIPKAALDELSETHPDYTLLQLVGTHIQTTLYDEGGMGGEFKVEHISYHNSTHFRATIQLVFPYNYYAAASRGTTNITQAVTNLVDPLDLITYDHIEWDYQP